MGKGGILLDPDSGPERWSEGLDEILGSKENYLAYSAAALEYSKRAEISVEVLSQRFIRLMSEAVKR